MRDYCPILLIAALSLVVATAACRKTPERRFEVKGKVVSVDRDQGTVTMAHEEIKGYMDAMTMPFNVRDEWAMSVLAPGQHVEATLVVQEDRSWIEGLVISKQQEHEERVTGSVPKIGDEVPDFTLINQDDRKVSLNGYRKRPLLLTFIYTRCPLPDYCPLTSSNFSKIYRELQSRPERERPRLLTITIDPEHDRPPILREYAARYMNPARFEDWEFLTGSPEEIKKIASYFGLSYWRESDQIIHSLMTAYISPEGKIMRLYPGNKWTPEEVLTEMLSRL